MAFPSCISRKRKERGRKGKNEKREKNDDEEEQELKILERIIRRSEKDATLNVPYHFYSLISFLISLLNLYCILYHTVCKSSVSTIAKPTSAIVKVYKFDSSTSVHWGK